MAILERYSIEIVFYDHPLSIPIGNLVGLYNFRFKPLRG